MKVTLELLWDHFSITFGNVRATLGGTFESLFVYDGDFVATLGSFCDHNWHLRAALGAF